jgi:hypothetical protein
MTRCGGRYMIHCGVLITALTEFDILVEIFVEPA